MLGLCDTCGVTFSSFDFDIERLSKSIGITVDHHSSIRSFIQSADAGCYLCSQAFHAFRSEDRDLMRQLIASFPKPEQCAVRRVHDDYSSVKQDGRLFFSRLYLHVNAENNHLTAHYMFYKQYKEGLQEQGLLVDNVQFYWAALEAQLPLGNFKFSYIFTPDKKSYSPLSIPTSTNTGSDESWDFVVSCIEDCTTRHQKCQSRRDDIFGCPTRLLDIGRKPSDHVKLIYGENLQNDSKYVTLSHRWGSASLPLLTTHNMKQYEDAVPADKFGRTYLDAFDVTRRLGVRYIWIDSLCIIQRGDDMVDWKRQAGSMDCYYRNAFCNLSADWGGGDTGLYHERETQSFREARLDLRDKVTGEPVRFYSTDHRLWNREVLDAPLNCRGWVLQERLLAARVIHFCRSQIFWECCEKTLCETYPDRLPDATQNTSVSTRDIKQFKPSILVNIANWLVKRLGRPLNLREEQYLVWYDTIEKYSDCELSYANDRLIASAGIARFTQEALGDQYIAGLWRATLIQDLCWLVGIGSTQQPCPERHLAPSFSWVSVSKGVGTPSKNLMFTDAYLASACCIKYRGTRPSISADASCSSDEEVAENIFGPIDENTIELRLKGVLKSMRFKRRSIDWCVVPDTCINDYSTPELSIYPACSFDISPTSNDDIRATEESTYYYMPLIDTYADRRRTELDAQYGPDMHMFGPVALAAIVLQLEDAAMGRFRRIGLIHQSDHGLGEYSIKFHKRRDIVLKDQAAPEQLPCWQYDQTAQKHIIYVV